MIYRIIYAVFVLMAHSLLAVDFEHERPSTQDSQRKKSKIEFRSALHQLCHEGIISDIEDFLEVTSVSEINELVGQPAQTAFARFMKTYEAQNGPKVVTVELTNLVKLFMNKQAAIDPESLRYFEGAELYELSNYIRGKIIEAHQDPTATTMDSLINNLASIWTAIKTLDASADSIQNDIELQHIFHEIVKNRHSFFPDMVKRTSVPVAFSRTLNPLLKLFTSGIFNDQNEWGKFLSSTLTTIAIDNSLENWAAYLKSVHEYYSIKNEIENNEKFKTLIQPNNMANFFEIKDDDYKALLLGLKSLLDFWKNPIHKNFIGNYEYISWQNVVNTWTFRANHEYLMRSLKTSFLEDKSLIFSELFDDLYELIEAMDAQPIRKNIDNCIISNLFTINNLLLFKKWFPLVARSKLSELNQNGGSDQNTILLIKNFSKNHTKKIDDIYDSVKQIMDSKQRKPEQFFLDTLVQLAKSLSFLTRANDILPKKKDQSSYHDSYFEVKLAWTINHIIWLWQESNPPKTTDEFIKTFNPLLELFNSNDTQLLDLVKKAVFKKLCSIHIEDKKFENWETCFADFLEKKYFQENNLEKFNNLFLDFFHDNLSCLKALNHRLIKKNINIFKNSNLFMIVARKGNLKLAEDLLENGAIFDNPKLIKEAIVCVQPQALEFFLKNKGSMNLDEGDDLCKAVDMHGRAEDKDKNIFKKMISLLLKHGVNPNKTNYFNESALSLTLSPEIASLLLEHKAEYSPQCLLYAAMNHNLEMIRFWGDLGYDFNKVLDNNKRTSLIQYCFALDQIKKDDVAEPSEIQQTIITLFLEYGANINMIDKDKNSALTYAIRRRQKYVTEFLLSHSQVKPRNKDLKEAYRAFHQNNPDISIIRMVIANNAPIANEDLHSEFVKIALAEKDEFFNAINQNDLEKMKTLLEEDGAGIWTNLENEGVPIILSYENVTSEEMSLLIRPYITQKGQATKSSRKKNR